MRRAADLLAHHDWQLVLTSPLSRARDSAQILANALQLGEPVIIDSVTERAFGIGEGMQYSEWFALQHEGSPVAGAESDAAVDARVQKFLQTIPNFQSERILVVSHGGFIRRVLRKLSANTLPPAESRLGNASLQRIARESDSWSVLEWNPASLAND